MLIKLQQFVLGCGELAYFHGVNSPTVATVKRSQNVEHPTVISSRALLEGTPPITFSHDNKQSFIYSESTLQMLFMRQQFIEWKIVKSVASESRTCESLAAAVSWWSPLHLLPD